jgi:hypothetical protein
MQGCAEFEVKFPSNVQYLNGVVLVIGQNRQMTTGIGYF